MMKFASAILICLFMAACTAILVLVWKDRDNRQLTKIREDIVTIVLADAVQKQEKVNADVQEIFKLISANNSTQGVILGHQGRLLHYLAGHDSFHKFCPECGLIEQLELRRKEIDDRSAELSAFIEANPNDPSIADKKKEITDLAIEANEATRRIFHSQQRAKEIGSSTKVTE